NSLSLVRYRTNDYSVPVAYRDRVHQADADMVARVGVLDLDVLAGGARGADPLVGLAYRDLG
ncbi:MAG: hypothetical protein QF398_13485, partial [Alphaproteobacteria bacterium]|nr:hypothetical protein [Alphaproteobacteria bacterium]